MRKTTLALSLLLIQVALQVSCAPHKSSNEAAVYAAFVNARFTSEPTTKRQFSQVVIGDLTVAGPPQDALPSIQRLKPVPDSATVSDFFFKNRSYFGGFTRTRIRNGLDGKRPIASDVHFAIPHSLLSESSLEKIVRNGNWDEFHRRYPNCSGFLSLSRVGFNRTESEALLYFEWWINGEAGAGSFVLLHKGPNGWVEVGYVSVWSA